MKKEVLLIIAVLLSTSIHATCDVTGTFDESSSKFYVVDGKDYNITFYSLKNESGDISVKFKVNGVSTDDLEEGMRYTFSDISEIKILDITVGSASLNNTARICFNAGLSGKKGTCSSNEDCDDNNPCTIDECEGDPLRCRRTLILWCRDNDGCCPESRCTPEKDSDCRETSEIINETINGSLVDNGPFINKTTVECISDDNYCPLNCTFTKDNDCDECEDDANCDDDNACTSDTCSGSPKRCLNNATTGCNFNGKCVSTGTRTEDKFCNKNNIMESFRSKKEYCDNNYECLNNQCIKNKCKSSFFKSIINWFKGLFNR